MNFPFTYQMSDTDGSALCHGNSKQINEHHYIHHIGTGSQRFIPQQINKLGQYYLRETVGHIFSGRGDSDFQQVFQLDKREGAKIG